MSHKKIIFAIGFTVLFLVLLCSLGVFFVWPRRGHQALTVTNISKPFVVSVHSPRFALHGGLYVIVEGHLDSDASLEIISNHGRGRQEIALHSPQIAIATGGGEEWVDDLQVEYHPNAAKAGQLYVSIYCGKNLTPDDATRFNQIRRTQ
jgi:hypothetical protein